MAMTETEQLNLLHTIYADFKAGKYPKVMDDLKHLHNRMTYNGMYADQDDPYPKYVFANDITKANVNRKSCLGLLRYVGIKGF